MEQADYLTMRLTAPDLVTCWVGFDGGVAIGDTLPPQPVQIVVQTSSTAPRPMPRRMSFAANFLLTKASGNKRIGRITKADAVPGRVSEKTTVI